MIVIGHLSAYCSNLTYWGQQMQKSQNILLAVLGSCSVPHKEMRCCFPFSEVTIHFPAHPVPTGIAKEREANAQTLW